MRHVQVLVNGVDVRDMNLHWLRSQVGLVSQEPILFSCSVRENICYGRPDATQEEVQKAAEAANAHSFIQKLPEGYSTQVHTAAYQGFSGNTITDPLFFYCYISWQPCLYTQQQIWVSGANKLQILCVLSLLFLVALCAELKQHQQGFLHCS